jgi:hypothetical protein
MEDISPGLLKKIRKDFIQQVETNSTLKALYEAIMSGNASYIQAEDYAYEVGSALAESFGKHLSSDVLPDGKMYFNIAESVVRPLLEEDHSIIADAAAQVQNSLNKKAGINIKAQTVPVNDDRITGIVDKISDADTFDDVAWVLDEPIKNFSMNVVDEVLRANVDFQGKAGLRPKIIRRAERKCCSWCAKLAGVYDYPVDREVYQRHERCRCTVDYDPGTGRRQNVWTKEYYSNNADLEARKNFTGIESQKGVRNAPDKLGPSVMSVMPEYLRKASPGVGTIAFDEGYNKNSHADEIKTAQWLLKNFGGNIVLLNESDNEGEKRADFIWNGQFWDLKSTTTAKAADSAIRKGLKQIKENPGGIILDYGTNAVSLDDVQKTIDGRMLRGSGNNADIMVVKNGQVVKILRYKK